MARWTFHYLMTSRREAAVAAFSSLIEGADGAAYYAKIVYRRRDGLTRSHEMLSAIGCRRHDGMSFDIAIL